MQGVLDRSPELIQPFTSPRSTRFHRLVRVVARRGRDLIADGRPRRLWVLTLPDRVLSVAVRVGVQIWRS
jgi:hypothetical protein